MLAYIPYMDPMGHMSTMICQVYFTRTKLKTSMGCEAPSETGHFLPVNGVRWNGLNGLIQLSGFGGYSSSGWWFGCHEFYFPIYWVSNHPN